MPCQRVSFSEAMKKAVSHIEFSIKMSSRASRGRDWCQLQTEVVILLKEALPVIPVLINLPAMIDARHRPGVGLASLSTRSSVKTGAGNQKGSFKKDWLLHQ